MRALLDQFKSDVHAFVEQRDNLLMGVVCTEVETAIGLKPIEEIDTENDTDSFLLFGDDLLGLEAYAQVVTARLREPKCQN